MRIKEQILSIQSLASELTAAMADFEEQFPKVSIGDPGMGIGSTEELIVLLNGEMETVHQLSLKTRAHARTVMLHVRDRARQEPQCPNGYMTEQ